MDFLLDLCIGLSIFCGPSQLFTKWREHNLLESTRDFDLFSFSPYITLIYHDKIIGNSGRMRAPVPSPNHLYMQIDFITCSLKLSLSCETILLFNLATGILDCIHISFDQLVYNLCVCVMIGVPLHVFGKIDRTMPVIKFLSAHKKKNTKNQHS